MKRFVLAIALTLPFIGFSQDNGVPEMTYVGLDQRTTLVTAWAYYEGHLIPANYLIVEGDSSSILMDTPWNDEQTEEIIAWSKKHLDVPISIAVITHAHVDRMGGIATLHKNGIRTYIHEDAQTMNAKEDGYEPAQNVFSSYPYRFDLGGVEINVIDPGTGHAPGNLILTIGRHGTYGGCFIKSYVSKDIGNLSHADLPSWKRALEESQVYFERKAWVIPGHGKVGPGCYERTVQLVDEAISMSEE
ncbi:MBL fold metallo-hydrolase [Phaeocystidibacter marisrubri]|uniref:MBL fold metallo-hydrolase n=1 Tax=Phaeocystidibacter marisrubri TaxID=1577780 RepID=A0A6L3ZJ51_9FLAO|nr:MBL fold metallo-hydrolase [Phaeocystidibacter marisrubri]KAB2817954.1 MBL fold metallo-hydrolase [Phaeocystidibacter marisrubri]GGH72690.1 beta-lactamase [Phaeocystidibacter marisrubri]